METAEIKQLTYLMLLQSLPHVAYEQLQSYVQLLERWNARMNLTALRDTRVLVELHIGESLRCAQMIPEGVASVLDFGSGAGLPGIPIQIARPELKMTLAESQRKKAAFLREAARKLELSQASVFAGRVEDLPAGQRFDLVVLRAVDRMDVALQSAVARIGPGGFCMILTSQAEKGAVISSLPDFSWKSDQVPGTRQRVILLGCSTRSNCST